MTFTKFGKKIMAFLAVITLGLVLVGCISETPTLTVEEAQAKVETAAGRIVFDPTVTSNLTSNISLASKYAAVPEIEYSWESSHEDLISIVKNEDGTITGAVTRPKIDDERIPEGADYVEVTLKATLTLKATNGTVVTASKEITFKVTVFKIDVHGSIKAVKDAAINEYVKSNYAVSSSTKDYALSCVTYGRVAAYVGNKSMFVADGNDIVLVYGDFTKETKLGDLVKVEGLVYGYYGQIEFGDEVNVTPLAADDKVLDEDGNEWRSQDSFAMPTYEATTIEAYTNSLKASVNAGNRIVDAEAFVPFSGGAFNLSGILVKEDLATGDDYALIDPFNGEKIALYHYSTDDKEVKDLLNGLVGKYVKLNAITVDRYSTNDMYRILLVDNNVEEVSAPALTDAQKVAFVAKQLEYAFAELNPIYYNGQELAFPTVDFAEYKDVQVKWTSAPEGVLVDGKLVVAADGYLTLTAEVSLGEVKETAEVEIEVQAKEKISLIEEVYAGNDDDLFIIVGKVEAVFSSYKNFYITDESGTILVYASLPDGIKAGDTVKVSGARDTYNGCAQISKDGATITLVEAGEWQVPSVKEELTVKEALAYTQDNAPFNKYVSLTGVVIEDGKYLAIADPADETVYISLYNSTTDVIAPFAGAGKEVTLKVYFYGFGSNGLPRVVFCGRDGEYVLPELSDAEKVATVLASLENGVVNASGEYPLATEENGCKLAWELVDGAGVATLAENVLTITQGEAEAVVKVKVTVTCGAENGSKELTLTVAKEAGAEHAGTETDPYTASDAALVTSKLENKVATETEYYVTGTVKEIQELSTSYGNATYVITDGTTDFLIFRGKNLNNEKFTSEDQLKIGDVVVVKGKLVNYDGTLEMNSGNYLISVVSDGGTTPEPNPDPNPDPNPNPDPLPATGSVTYTFSDLTDKGSELTAESALEIFGAENGLVSVEVTKVYNGNGTGGAYENTAGLLKFGTSSKEGVLKLNFAEGTKVAKVVISCHDWYKLSDKFPTNSNTVSVNGSTAVLAPYNAEGTPADMEFVVGGENYVEITSSKRIFVFSITVYFAE